MIWNDYLSDKESEAFVAGGLGFSVKRKPMSGTYKQHTSMEAYDWNTWPSLNTSRAMKSEDPLREGARGFTGRSKKKTILPLLYANRSVSA